MLVLRIGIDADGVLTDMSKFYFEQGERYFKRKPSNPEGYSISEIFDCSSKQEFRFGLRHFVKYCKDCPPRANCVESIIKLNADGHELYEITARKFVTMKNPLGWYSRHLFESWLKQHEMEFKEIFYCSESNSSVDRLNGCKQFNIDVMIDDRPNVALFLAENGIRVLLFDSRYNQNVEHMNIVRVADWEDIYQEIGYMIKLKGK